MRVAFLERPVPAGFPQNLTDSFCRVVISGVRRQNRVASAWGISLCSVIRTAFRGRRVTPAPMPELTRACREMTARHDSTCDDKPGLIAAGHSPVISARTPPASAHSDAGRRHHSRERPFYIRSVAMTRSHASQTREKTDEYRSTARSLRGDSNRHQ